MTGKDLGALGGTKGNFSKIAQKVAFVWKAQKHSAVSGIIPELGYF